MSRRVWICWARLLLILLVSGFLGDFSEGCEVGTSNPSGFITETGNTTDGRAFMIDAEASACCGSLTTWKFYASAPGTITAMVWRPTTGDNHELVATEDLTAAAVGLSTLTPATPLDIEIGDKIGWKTTGSELITSAPKPAGSTSLTQQQLLATTTLNTEVPWALTPETNTYAFGAVVTENEVPTVSTATVTITVTQTSASIHTIGIVDSDTALITDLDVTMTSSPAAPGLSLVEDATGFNIVTGTSLTAGTYSLTINATDKCQASGTAVITVIVQDQVPVFDPNPLPTVHATSISDMTTTSVSLMTFSVTDTDPATCSTDNPLFSVTYAAPDHTLSLTPTSATSLDYDSAASVSATITCGDGTTNITSTYTVNISDEPAVLTGLGSASSIGDLSAIGTAVSTFTATDQDDDVDCTVDAPLNTVFSITETSTPPGAQTFELRTSATLNEDTTASYAVQVTCSDGQNTATGTHTLTVTDDPPTLTGLPATTATQNDGVQSGGVIHSVTVTDANDLGSIACSIGSPNDLLFSITGTAPNFDISTIATTTLVAASAPYVLTISCNDDETTNIVTGTLTVPLVDTPPTFVGTFPASYPALSDDTVTATLLDAFTVSEPNVNCSVTTPASSPYEVTKRLVPANPDESEFEIKVAATVTEADINFDNVAAETLIIECSDGTSSITGSYVVNIVDADPVLTGLPGTAYSSVSDSATAAQQLDSFTVTDSDDIISCEVVPGDVSTANFEVVAGTLPVFWISLKNSPVLNADTTPSYTVPIQCTDGTTPAIVTGTKVINIISAPPVFVDLPSTVSNISDATDAATVLHSFSVTDTPTSTITCSLSAPAPYDNDFTIVDSSPSFEVQLEATNDLNFDVDNSIAVSVTCSDGSNNITDVLTVELYDEDPVWTLLPAAGPFQTLNDAEPLATSLYTFSVADSDDVINCEVDPSTPEATSFEIIAGTPPEFQVWYKGPPLATLDSSVSDAHDITIVCGDGVSYSHSEIYQVELANSPATFINLPDATPVISESETSKILLYTFTVTDTTELECYLTSPADVPGISIGNKMVALPNTVYSIYAESAVGYDYDAGTGSLAIDVSCTDMVTAVTETLTVTIENSPPVINNPGGSTTVSEDEAGAVTLKVLDIIAYDRDDTTCTMTDNDGGPFDVDPTDGKTIVKLAGALDYETKTFYTLKVECEDTLGLSVIDTYIVNVENKVVEITNLPLGGIIQEDREAEEILQALTLSEDAAKCFTVGDIQPEFNVKIDPATNLWSIYYVAGNPLDYQIKPYYEICVQCEDATGVPGSTKCYSITVIPNEEPTFTNLPGNMVHEVQAKDVLAGDPVYVIETADAEGNPVTVNKVSCSDSATCPFVIIGNEVVSTADLHSYPDDFYVLTVELEDKYNQNVGTRDLFINIKDINTNPIITNIPTYDEVVGIVENNAPGASVFQISVEDPDVGDVLTYTCEFTDGGDAHFDCDSATGVITAKNSLDFETMSQRDFHVNVSVNDGYNTTVASELLTLSVNHENEQPTFTKQTWSLTKLDEGGNGDVVGCPDFYDGIDDEDLANSFEYFTFTMDCPGGDGAFHMDSLTGCVTMTKEWDLDAVNKRTESETIPCTVTATDYGGLQTTATLNIEINDEDDNKPYLDKTSYKFCATVNTTSGTLGAITADDNDVAAANKDLSFDFPGGGPFGSTGNGGQLTYGDMSGYPVGTVFETSISVTDKAGHTDSADVTVIVCDPPTTTTNNNANSSSSSSSSATDSMLLWLIPLILLGLLLLGLLAFLLYKYCGKCKCCRCRSKPTKVIRREEVRTERREPVKVIEEKKPPQTLGLMELPMTRFYARETGNLGASYPVVM